MQQLPTTVQGTLQYLRLIYGVLLLCIPLYVYVMQFSGAWTSEPLNPLLPWVFGAFCIANLCAVQTIRSRKIPPALETLRSKPDDAKSLTDWRTGAVVSAASAESVAVFGGATHLLGGNRLQVAPFIIVGAAAMLFWWPRRP